MFKRSRDAGDQLDNSETPVYSCDVKKMNKAYATKDGSEPAMRKFCLTNLQRAAGRTGEGAWVTWDGLGWDTLFK